MTRRYLLCLGKNMFGGKGIYIGNKGGGGSPYLYRVCNNFLITIGRRLFGYRDIELVLISCFHGTIVGFFGARGRVLIYLNNGNAMFGYFRFVTHIISGTMTRGNGTKIGTRGFRGVCLSFYVLRVGVRGFTGGSGFLLGEGEVYYVVGPLWRGQLVFSAWVLKKC